jgi:hypothetical protein
MAGTEGSKTYKLKIGEEIELNKLIRETTTLGS